MRTSLRALAVAGAFLMSQMAFASSDHFVTKDMQTQLTPTQVLTKLEQGNARYVSNTAINYDQQKLAWKGAKYGQAPYAFVVSCIDSRSTPTIVFNQPEGSLFVSRLAGNPVSPDVLGGMEFATKFVGTKLIVVMGHTHCGAITGACAGVDHPEKLGALLKLFSPAVNEVAAKSDKPLDCEDPATINAIAKQNVLDQMQIAANNPTIAAKLKAGQVKIVGAMHDLDTGKVQFFDMDGKDLN